MKAWLGDLVLNAAVARELMKKRSERQSVVTNHNVCVSNEFLYNRANSILTLPKHITDDEKYRKLSEHQIGTSELSANIPINASMYISYSQTYAYLSYQPFIL